MTQIFLGDNGAATPPSIEVQAAVTAIRETMASRKCNFDKAYLTLQGKLRRLNRHGVESEWTARKDAYDAAYKILARDYKGAVRAEREAITMRQAERDAQRKARELSDE